MNCYDIMAISPSLYYFINPTVSFAFATFVNSKFTRSVTFFTTYFHEFYASYIISVIFKMQFLCGSYSFPMYFFAICTAFCPLLPRHESKPIMQITNIHIFETFFMAILFIFFVILIKEIG